jgi:hypothetical protein
MTSGDLVLGNLNLNQPNYFASDYGFKFWIQSGLDEMPTVRGGSDFLPMRPGRLHLRRIGDSIPLVLQGFVRARTNAEFRLAMDILQGLFDPTIAVPVRLTEYMPDGTARYVNVVPNNSIASSDELEPQRLYSVALDSMDAQWRTNWGTLTADSLAPVYADTGAMAQPIGERPYFADSSAEALIYPTSWQHTFQLDTRSIGQVDDIRVTFDQGSSGSDDVNDPTGDNFPGTSRLGIACTPAGAVIPLSAGTDTTGTVGCLLGNSPSFFGPGPAFSPSFTGPGPAFTQQNHLRPGTDLLVIDNRLRRFEWAGETTSWAWQSMFSEIQRFPGNRGGELLRFGPGLQTVTIYGWPYRARIQWTPTIP